MAIAVIVVVLCMCACCVASFGGAEFYASSVLTATASAPTDTPEATATPPPTFTPNPTATPVPSATPTPNPMGHLSPDEQQFLQAFRDQSRRWTESRSKYDALMANPKPADGTWKAEVTAALAAWKELVGQARGQSTPGKFAAAHQKYLQAAQHFESAAELATVGINEQDVVSFDQSKEEIASGDSAMTETRNQVEALAKP